MPSTSPDPGAEESPLTAGIQAALAGSRVLARQHLEHAAKLDPQDYRVWLWLGWTCESPSSSKLFLSKAESLAPENPAAQQGLRWISSILDEVSQPTHETTPSPKQAGCDANITDGDANITDGDANITDGDANITDGDANIMDGIGVEPHPYVDLGSSDAFGSDKSADDVPNAAFPNELSTSDTALTLPAQNEIDAEVARMVDSDSSCRDQAPPQNWQPTGASPENVAGEYEESVEWPSAQARSLCPDNSVGPFDVDEPNDHSVEESLGLSVLETAEEMRVALSNRDAAVQRESDPDSEQTPSPLPDLEVVNESTNRHVLIVDDSPTVRKLVAMTLEQVQCQVRSAEDGAQAIDMIRTERPSLVLLDVNMPKLNGYQLCKILKKNTSTRAIPVVMLSAKDGVFDKLRGTLVGCDAYMTKPFESTQLVETVTRYCGPFDTHDGRP